MAPTRPLRSSRAPSVVPSSSSTLADDGRDRDRARDSASPDPLDGLSPHKLEEHRREEQKLLRGLSRESALRALAQRCDESGEERHRRGQRKERAVTADVEQGKARRAREGVHVPRLRSETVTRPPAPTAQLEPPRSAVRTSPGMSSNSPPRTRTGNTFRDARVLSSGSPAGPSSRRIMHSISISSPPSDSVGWRTTTYGSASERRRSPPRRTFDLSSMGQGMGMAPRPGVMSLAAPSEQYPGFQSAQGRTPTPPVFSPALSHASLTPLRVPEAQEARAESSRAAETSLGDQAVKSSPTSAHANQSQSQAPVNGTQQGTATSGEARLSDAAPPSPVSSEISPPPSSPVKARPSTLPKAGRPSSPAVDADVGVGASDSVEMLFQDGGAGPAALDAQGSSGPEEQAPASDAMASRSALPSVSGNPSEGRSQAYAQDPRPTTSTSLAAPNRLPIAGDARPPRSAALSTANGVEVDSPVVASASSGRPVDNTPPTEASRPAKAPAKKPSASAADGAQQPTRARRAGAGSLAVLGSKGREIENMIWICFERAHMASGLAGPSMPIALTYKPWQPSPEDTERGLPDWWYKPARSLDPVFQEQRRRQIQEAKSRRARAVEQGMHATGSVDPAAFVPGREKTTSWRRATEADDVPEGVEGKRATRGKGKEDKVWDFSPEYYNKLAASMAKKEANWKNLDKQKLETRRYQLKGELDLLRSITDDAWHKHVARIANSPVDAEQPEQAKWQDTGRQMLEDEGSEGIRKRVIASAVELSAWLDKALTPSDQARRRRPKKSAISEEQTASRASTPLTVCETIEAPSERPATKGKNRPRRLSSSTEDTAWTPAPATSQSAHRPTKRPRLKLEAPGHALSKILSVQGGTPEREPTLQLGRPLGSAPSNVTGSARSAGAVNHTGSMSKPSVGFAGSIASEGGFDPSHGPAALASLLQAGAERLHHGPPTPQLTDESLDCAAIKEEPNVEVVPARLSKRGRRLAPKEEESGFSMTRFIPGVVKGKENFDLQADAWLPEIQARGFEILWENGRVVGTRKLLEGQAAPATNGGEGNPGFEAGSSLPPQRMQAWESALALPTTESAGPDPQCSGHPANAHTGGVPTGYATGQHAAKGDRVESAPARLQDIVPDSQPSARSDASSTENQIEGLLAPEAQEWESPSHRTELPQAVTERNHDTTQAV